MLLERDGYPAGVPCFVDTTRSDPAAAADFYGGLFGWEREDRMPADAPGHYFMARLRGRDVAAIGSQSGDGAGPPAWSTYICVDSADETAAKVWAAGGTVLTEPFDVFDAGRMAVLADPSGAEFCVWQAYGHKGAELVNEPGTWNWSVLDTRDLEGAKAFYGAVFGWETDAIEFGGADSAMVRMPGYAEVLELHDPDLRRRHAEGGAPSGFGDAIAWMVSMSPEQVCDDTPAHWSVTFSVDDADAISDRAAKLGGTIAVAPYDIPPVRLAVLSDPQGAVFTISRYDPS